MVNINGLEYAGAEIYANLWHTDVIAVISPASGEVTAWIDLEGLNPDRGDPASPCVLNGIAYDEGNGRFLVTGKCWPLVYDIEVIPQPHEPARPTSFKALPVTGSRMPREKDHIPFA